MTQTGKCFVEYGSGFALEFWRFGMMIPNVIRRKRCVVCYVVTAKNYMKNVTRINTWTLLSVKIHLLLLGCAMGVACSLLLCRWVGSGSIYVTYGITSTLIWRSMYRDLVTVSVMWRCRLTSIGVPNMKIFIVKVLMPGKMIFIWNGAMYIMQHNKIIHFTWVNY